MSILKCLVKIIYAPFMLVGFGLAAATVILYGYSYFYLGLLIILAIGCSFAMEQIAPYQRSWNESHKDRLRDLIHALVNEANNVLALALLPIVTCFSPNLNIWPISWPIWIQFLFAILVADCGITLLHYLSHRVSILWRFHAVHHSVKRLYGFNGLMKHPFHQAIETLGGTFPLILIGIPVDIAAFLAFMVSIQLLLQHSNVDIKIGPLRYVLALSPLHRFHHIKWPLEGDVNFGLFTTIWDYLLGTAFYDPSRKFTSEDLGVGKEPNFPIDYFPQLIKPFNKVGDIDSSN